MLFVKFGADEREIHNIDSYFDNSYEDEWFQDKMVKEIVRDIDKTEIISPYVAVSPVLGSIPVTSISGGAKVLILMLKRPGILHPGDSCGDNCAGWICRIASMHDITMSLTYPMKFPEDVTLTIVDTGRLCRSRAEFIEEYLAWDF